MIRLITISLLIMCRRQTAVNRLKGEKQIFSQKNRGEFRRSEDRRRRTYRALAMTPRSGKWKAEDRRRGAGNGRQKTAAAGREMEGRRPPPRGGKWRAEACRRGTCRALAMTARGKAARDAVGRRGGGSGRNEGGKNFSRESASNFFTSCGKCGKMYRGMRAA